MDDIELTCPCCSALLGIDECGDLFPIKHAETDPCISRGLGGLTVVHADPRWKETNYAFNQQGHDTNNLIEFGFPVLADPAPLDPLVEAEADNDLKNKGIK